MATNSQPTLVVYRGFPERDAYVWSPFVTKLEARLRFAGVPYTYEQGSIKQAPRGKIPFVAFSNNSNSNQKESPQLLADTQLISEKLVEEGILPNLNEKLSPAEKALDLAVKALVEDKLYFYNTNERWNENYYTMRDKILASIPYPIRVAVGLMVRRNVTNGLYAQGTGRFSAEEIRSFRENVWRRIEDLLADAAAKHNNNNDNNNTDDKSGVFWIFGGKEPTEADTAVYGFIIGGLVCEAGPESRKLIRSLPSVVDYARRIHEKYFSDYKSPVWE